MRLGPLWWLAPAHQGAGSLPLSAHVALQDRCTLPVDTRYPFGGPGTVPINPETFPVTETGLPIYKSTHPDYCGTPHDVQDIIRDSEQLSVTTYTIPITTLASPNIKCVDPTGSGTMQT